MSTEDVQRMAMKMIRNWLQKFGWAKKQESANEPQPEESNIACCSEDVHIAYRGLADDRLYMSYNRKWPEVRYYRANGLRVFCAKCRHRVL